MVMARDKILTDMNKAWHAYLDALEKSLELLKTYPDLKAIMGSAMSTVPGAAQANGRHLHQRVV